MSAAATSKKRKRAQVEADNASSQANVSLVSSTLPVSQLGPVLVAYPSITPPEGTGFDYYIDTANDRGDKPKVFAQRKAIVQGEAPTVDFRTAQQMDANETGSTYYIAIHNKRTKTTTFRPVPLHTLQREPKALKALPSAAVSASDRLAARTALGGAFGTKKAQANLRAQERNKIDVAAMAGVVGSLQDRVQNNTAALPSKEEAKSASDASRPIPPYNLSAETPSQAYPLTSIAPAPEWTALSSSLVQPLLAASSNQERSALLPERSSEWVWSHLKTIFAPGTRKPKRDQVKVVAYVSALMAFRKMYRALDNPTKLAERLHTVPAVCIEGMVDRFAQTARGAATAQKTSEGETKLLTHIFALCLHADNFATDTAVLAKDLQMTVSTVNTLFKALGCKVSKLSATDAKKLGLGDAGVDAKRAVLSVPLTFPDPRAKRKKAAGR